MVGKKEVLNVLNSPNPDNPILLVDNDSKILDAVEAALRMAGFDNITSIQDSRDVIRTMERRIPGLVLLDLNMPHISGNHLLKEYPQNLAKNTCDCTYRVISEVDTAVNGV